MTSNHYNGTDLLDLLVKHQVPFAEGNIMKYVFRWRKKGGIDDLFKARDYLNALVEQALIESTLPKEPF